MTLTDGSDQAALKGKLLVNEMMGSELHLHISTGNEQNVILRLPTLGLSEDVRRTLVGGKELSFTFPGKAAQLFDPDTGKSLLFG